MWKGAVDSERGSTLCADFNAEYVEAQAGLRKRKMWVWVSAEFLVSRGHLAECNLSCPIIGELFLQRILSALMWRSDS